jgi:hypothetical protein
MRQCGLLHLRRNVRLQFLRECLVLSMLLLRRIRLSFQYAKLHGAASEILLHYIH